MFKLKRFNQVQEGLSSQDFASGEFIMRYKRLIRRIIYKLGQVKELTYL